MLKKKSKPKLILNDGPKLKTISTQCDIILGSDWLFGFRNWKPIEVVRGHKISLMNGVEKGCRRVEWVLSRPFHHRTPARSNHFFLPPFFSFQTFENKRNTNNSRHLFSLVAFLSIVNQNLDMEPIECHPAYKWSLFVFFVSNDDKNGERNNHKNSQQTRRVESGTSIPPPTFHIVFLCFFFQPSRGYTQQQKATTRTTGRLLVVVVVNVSFIHVCRE